MVFFVFPRKATRLEYNNLNQTRRTTQSGKKETYLQKLIFFRSCVNGIVTTQYTERIPYKDMANRLEKTTVKRGGA